MKNIIVLFAIAYAPYLASQDAPAQIKVMTWNILHGAKDIQDGPEKVIEIIQEIDPDVILMVETYGSGPKIAEALGFHFHLIAPPGTAPNDKSINLSIYSRYPFGDRLDTAYPFYLGGREIIIQDQKIRFFSNWFHYLPWEDEPEKLGKSAVELLEWEKTGKKYEMIQKIRPYFEKYAAEADSLPLIISGDMNTPSHLDWGANTRSIHNDLVVPWYATRFMEELGLVDTYRYIHPNPLTHPGITWNTKGKKDEHRIDYIFYQGEALLPIDSYTHQAYLNESLVLNGKEIPYPSDHGFVVTVFELR